MLELVLISEQFRTKKEFLPARHHLLMQYIRSGPAFGSFGPNAKHCCLSPTTSARPPLMSNKQTMWSQKVQDSRFHLQGLHSCALPSFTAEPTEHSKEGNSLLLVCVTRKQIPAACVGDRAVVVAGSGKSLPKTVVPSDPLQSATEEVHIMWPHGWGGSSQNVA